MTSKRKFRARIASLAALAVVLVSGAVSADPRGAIDPKDLISPLTASGQHTNIDPDMGEYGDGVSKREHTMMRDAYLAQRIGPLPEGVANPRLKAALEVKRRLESIPTIQIGNPNDGWVPYGPSPIPDGTTIDRTDPTSGRTISLAVHPANSLIVYAGTAGGGLYRSIDGGSTWTSLFDMAASLAIGSLAISPVDPDTLYVGTGEPNRSCDSLGGVGWYRVEDASTAATLKGPFDINGDLQRRAISKIIPHPTDATRMLISVVFGRGGVGCQATSPVAELYSVTGITGSSPVHTVIGSLPATTVGVTDLALPSTNTLLAGVSTPDGNDDDGIYRSTNPWSASPTFTRVAIGRGRIEFGVGGSTIVAAIEVGENPVGGVEHEGAVIRSTNGGSSWTMLSDGNGFCRPQCWYDMAVGVHPTQTNTIMLGGSFGDEVPNAALLRTTNGTDFSPSQAGLHADTHALAFSPSNPDVVYVGSDGGIWRSTNAGATWVSRNTTGFSATQFVSVASHPTDGNLIVGGTQDNGTLMRSGSTWQTLEGGDGGYAAIDGGSGGADDARIYHTFYAEDYNRIFYHRATSVSGAKNGEWDSIGCYNGKSKNGITCNQSILFYPPLVLGPGSPNTIYLGSTTLWRSADGGETHASAGSAPNRISAIAIGPSNDAIRVIGTEVGDVRRTTTGGSLSDVTGPWANAFVSAVAIDPSNSNTVYVGLSAYRGTAAQQIWKTTNLSASSPTWTLAAGGMPDVPVNDLVIDPRNSNKIYAATDVGVFVSTNGGSAWNPMPGMPIVTVYDLVVTRAGTINQRLRAATHGRGIWEKFIGERIPVVKMQPAAIGFGKQQVGNTSSVQTLSVRNEGNAKLTTTTVALSGSPAFEIVSNQCEMRTINPGSSCAIGVTYRPPDFASHSATITVATNAAGSPHAVGLSGQGSIGPVPSVQLSRKLFKWEMLMVGSERTEIVQVSNAGTAPMTLGASSVVGTHVNQFRVTSDACNGATLQPGGACTVKVAFAPTAVGGYQAGLSVPNSAGANQLVDLSATGQTPEVAAPVAMPDSVSFGTRTFASGTSRVVKLQNRGTGPMSVVSASIDGGSSGFSVLSDRCTAATVTPGRDCSVTVNFTPPYFGGWNDTLVFDTGGEQVLVPLDGSGGGTETVVSPAGRAEPQAVWFGTVRAGTTSSPRGIRIVNDGSGPMNVESIVLVADEREARFTVADQTCTHEAILPGESCSVSVAFAPDAAGIERATLAVETNGGTVNARVSGEGFVSGVPGIAVTPSVMHFDPLLVSSSSGRSAVVVTNPGTAPVALGLVSLGGDDPDSFELANDGCSLQIVAPGGACTVALRFRPQAEGEMMATLGIASNATAAPVAIQLYGSGLTADVPEAAAYPRTLDFASQIVGTSSAYRVVSLTNVGTATVPVGAAVVEGPAGTDFAAVDYCSGRSLAPGHGCVVYLSFSPTQVGSRVASLRLPWADGQSVVPLTGTGVEAPTHPGLAFAPSSLQFGFVKVDASSAVQTVTVRSTGSDPLVVERIELAGVAMDQFARVADTCTGGTFAPGTRCTVGVRFRPDAAGAHVASLMATTNAGRGVISLAGTADGTGPVSSFDTPNTSVMIRVGDQIRGQTQDDHAVDTVTVSYVNVLGGAEQVRATILSCPTATRCTWRAALPTLPGIYTAVATGTDKAGNVESPGPRITIVVV